MAAERRRTLEVRASAPRRSCRLKERRPHVWGRDNWETSRPRLDEELPYAKDRLDLVQTDASRMRFPAETFDAAFLCWILEHVADTEMVL